MISNPNMRLIKTGGPAVLPLLDTPRPSTLRLAVKDGQILPTRARIVVYDTPATPVTSIQEPAEPYPSDPL